MDTPTLVTRRGFLHRGLALVGAGSAVPAFLLKSAHAMNDPGRPQAADEGAPTERVLVVLQMAGGNDGLNTVVPFRDDQYHRLRPKLRLPDKDLLRITADLGFHPAATGLRTLLDAGRLCVVQSVGYPNPNRSHFKSMDVWHTASPEGRAHDGWLGRYLDRTCCDQRGCDPLGGLALMEESPLALRGERFTPATFQNADELRLRPVGDGKRSPAVIRELHSTPPPRIGGGELTTLDFLRRAAMDSVVSAERLRRAAGVADVGRDIPRSPLGRALRQVARFIAAELPSRVYYVSMGGFDTHSRQLDRHRRLMNVLTAALEGFVATLASIGHLERTLVLVFSEFGRRVAENASGGTDHGEAAPMFLVGDRVRAGVVGEPPDLVHLHRGDVPFKIDFRQVYAAVLRDWLGIEPRLILGSRYRPLPVLRR